MSTVKYKGHTFEVIEKEFCSIIELCQGCIFQDQMRCNKPRLKEKFDGKFNCSPSTRADGKQVIFKLKMTES